MSRRGQSQLVTAVLLTGILIVMVSAAYFWGVPIIEKQQDTVEMNNMERFMKEMDDKIQRVASSGGRERVENVNIPGELRLVDQGRNDRVELTFTTSGQIIATGADIYLRGDNRTTVPITENPSVIKAFSEKEGDEFRVEMTLKYREVVAADTSSQIDLKTGGRNVVGEGGHDVVIIHQGTETIRGAGKDGRDLEVVNVMLRFE